MVNPVEQTHRDDRPVGRSPLRIALRNDSSAVYASVLSYGASVLIVGLLVAGCAKSAHQTGQDRLDQVIPPDLMAQVDESVRFNDLRASPDTYIGRTVLFSGLAMNARRVKDRTEIEVLQLPTGAGLSPSDRRSQSEGRFLAVKTGEFFDPAVIEKGTPLTVLGEVKGTMTKPLDDGDYLYPVIEIKHLVDWNDVRSRQGDRYGSGYGYGYGGYPYYGYGPYAPWYYGYGSPWWGPYGLYPYSYYGPYFTPFGLTSPAPAPPPPASLPPRFQKSR